MNTITAAVSATEETHKQISANTTYPLNASKPETRHSDEELLSMLNHSDQQYHDGKAKNMKSAVMEARKKHVKRSPVKDHHI